MTEKYTLVGIDGNAFNVMGYVRRAMRNEKFPAAEIESYTKDATSGDYNHLLCVSSRMIEKCNEAYDETH